MLIIGIILLGMIAGAGAQLVLQRGSRLSVQPVTAPQARELLKLAEKNDGK